MLCFALQFAALGQTKKLALIIGNADYENGSPLDNPVNDAVLMSKTLTDLGFEVKVLTNADKKSMEAAAIEFTTKIPSYNVSLFYYAGHGVQLGGENYLLPVDAKLDSKASTKYEGFSINDINGAFASNSKNLNVMILDACRNNPFRSWMRGNSEGFVALKEQAAGTIIAFATREGETASDGKGSNGLYTEKLVEQLMKPQNITEVFQNTRVQVLMASNNSQCPQEWNMLTSNFYFQDDIKRVSPSPSANNFSTGFIAGKVKAKEYGNIVFDCEIEGKLYLNGKKLGNIEKKSTGNTIQNQMVGNHEIKIVGKKETLKKMVRVENGQTTRLKFRSKITKRPIVKYKDPRDKKVYRTQKIGGTIWMLDNLAYQPDVYKGCWAYNKDDKLVGKHGYLYDVETAKIVCPLGWRLPTVTDFKELVREFGTEFLPEEKAPAIWENKFKIQYSGMYDGSRRFNSVDRSALLWTSTQKGDEIYWRVGFDKKYGKHDFFVGSIYYGFSVRCVKDD